MRDSDATVIFTSGELMGGSALTAGLASSSQKPLLTLDLGSSTEEAAVICLEAWLVETQARVLNVAGPRASEAPEVAAATARVLRAALAREVG